MNSSFVFYLLTTTSLICPSTPTPTQSIKMPIKTIGDPSSTLHSVPIKLGTPPQTLHLLLDTGSDTSWVFCDRTSSSSSIDHRTFNHSLSSTFKFLDTRGYTHNYADGTSTSGYWATETMTFNSDDGSEVRIDNMVIGCSNQETTNFSDTDGVLALSASYPSLTSQLAYKFGNKFSYGLAEGDHLAFGETKRDDFNPDDMQYVKLVPADRNFFYVNVSSLFLDDVDLDISKKVWGFDTRDQAGGVILDTGTTSTYVGEEAYRAIRAYFLEFFRYSDNVKLTSSDICFSIGARLPRISIEFEGGARLDPLVEEVYFRDEEGMTCLAIWPVDDLREGSIIGSSMQKGYFWEYDLMNQRAGFAPLAQYS